MPQTLTTIARFVSWQDAFLVAGLLESHGISAVVQDSDTVRINWLYSNAIGGVKVQIPTADIRAARGVLSDFELARASRRVGAVADECPYCGSHDTRLIWKRKRLAYLAWLLIGFPVWRPTVTVRCSQCEAEWK